MSGATNVSCPQCGDEVPMGLPHGATVRAVTGTPDDDLDEEFVSDGGRRKRRTNRCKEGHDFYVYFEF